jgi:hypothetical protein
MMKHPRVLKEGGEAVIKSIESKVGVIPTLTTIVVITTHTTLLGFIHLPARMTGTLALIAITAVRVAPTTMIAVVMVIAAVLMEVDAIVAVVVMEAGVATNPRVNKRSSFELGQSWLKSSTLNLCLVVCKLTFIKIKGFLTLSFLKSQLSFLLTYLIFILYSIQRVFIFIQLS